MKKILIAMICLFALTAKAAIRTDKEMSQAACQALSALSGNASLAKGMGEIPSAGIEKLYDDSQLAVFGSSEAGYALVSYDDTWPAVLACSPHAFRGVSAPLSWYMQAVKQAMAYRQATTATLPASYGYAAAVEPFVETHWGQTKPYNDLCPTNASGEHYLTGCVATSMAQIMRYYRYPIHGTGTNTYGFTLKAKAVRVITSA